MVLPMPGVLNISAYKFTPFSAEELPALRDRLEALARDELGLLGTILLATEGINLFLAGPREAIGRFLDEVHAIPGLEDLTAKESESSAPPFRRMHVKIRKEIVTFGVEGIDPARAPAPRLDPRTLKQWLDEGRPVTLLDTRNDYEVRLGTFEKAIDPGIRSFREFPRALEQLPPELKEQPVVTFCTGGIRCEKAAPLLIQKGFRQVFQLEGGILKYFEHCGDAHYKGDCFVFDHRIGVDPKLAETATPLCRVCQHPLSEADLADPRHIPGKSCPHCAA